MNKVTVEWLQEHLMKDRVTEYHRCPRIECADGFSMSVQASSGHYCSPRVDNATWSQVEVGFPTEVPVHFLSYAESSEDPTDTVYGYVPVDLVVDEINHHGGVIES
ncbi:hypothetical protein [Metapseudomonas otitidis]|uniref:hypothetical protein n=1 Tax=Metapseudomonas otitidis TaxID=319939 RepID=UPI00244AD281|nr:hypothetical protein [Pseudomonas otitidis]MDG9785307.1 hypothetical protein [Pseudomonas otitidis]